MKYLTLIRAIALLRQYQREVKTVEHQGKTVEYIDVEPSDIEIANRLCHQSLGRSLDELAPQTRRLLSLLDEMVNERCDELAVERNDFRFTRREVRECTGFGMTQTRVHLDRLVELEYVLAHHGGRGQQFVYELVYDGGPQKSEPHLDGLIDVSALRTMTPTWRGDDPNLADTWRPHGGPLAGGKRGAERQVNGNDSNDLKPLNGKSLKNAHREAAKRNRT